MGNNQIFVSMFSGRSLCFEIGLEAGKYKSTRVWDSNQLAYMSTPVLIQGDLYMHTQSNRFACLDGKTGKLRWVGDITFGQYWSMVVNQNRILALDQKGILYLINASPEKWDLVDQRKISDNETWAHLAVCDEEVFVRDLKGITVYRWRNEKEKTTNR